MGAETVEGGTTVSRNEPPAFQLPFLTEGLNLSRGLFEQGAPEQYQGNTVVPFAPQTEQALAMQTARATNGSSMVDAAQNYVTNTLNNPSTNPHLDAMFGQAARNSRGVLESEFARSGRNMGAAAPARADMLTDLATRIYGGAYEGDRNHRAQMMGFVSPLAEQDYRDISALRGVGAEVEAQTGQVIDDAVRRHDYEQNAPGAWLDAYLNRIHGNMGGTTTTQLPPSYTNRGAGALGGALAGYQMGGGNPWLSLLGGLFGAYG